ncbi:cerberus [Python bivittatus]|uniref:Cerberus n=1 Tax=Python bivittatus TaxID=176946 RepID=A0A9F2R5C2_PYTBI|nr:cerberus [Python bivittatus]
MFLLLLQMLLISWLATAEQRGEMQQQKKRVPYILPHNVLTKYVGESKGTLREPEGSVVSLAEMEIKQQDLPQRPHFLFPYNVQRAADDLESWASASKAPAFTDLKHPPSHPQTKREAGSPFRKDAKKFWDLFMLKTKSRSEEVVLPIKINEIYQICNMLPFSQSITHENCERLVIQNNLCFGKCSSFHVPGTDDRMYSFCSHCSPTKFSMKHLKMNCTMVTPVIKVVMIIEECRCEVFK